MESEKTKELNMQQHINNLTILQEYAKRIATRDFFSTIHSQQIGELTKALTMFKLEMPELRTDKSAGGRYKYQSLPALLSSISSLLAKQGCSVSQHIQTISDTTYVVTLIMHTSGQFLRSVTKIPKRYTMIGKLVETDENLQAFGGAITYTKRHALKSILGIDADDDTDGNATTGKPATREER